MNQPIVSTNRYPHYDVAVCGGGMAGIAAAIASARQGASTILIEKAGWLGGMGITGATGLHSYFNIFDTHPGASRLRVAAGIAQELVDRTALLGGALGHVRMERGGDFVSMLTPVEPETFKLAAFQLCREAGVTLLLHTVIDEVTASNQHIESLTVWNKGGRSRITASQFVDCTGDGDLAAWSGAPWQGFAKGDPGAYSAGFTFRMVNVDLQRLEAFLESRGMITQMAHAVKPGMSQPDVVRLGIDFGPLREKGIQGLPPYFLSSSVRPREITYCNCINYGPNDGLDELALTEAEISLRGQMLGIARAFRENLAGCEDCYPAGPAPAAGQRRARAVHCRYEITQYDCVAGKQFDDQVGCFGFIDNPKFIVDQAGVYGIPYRALIPLDSTNLLIAGRMMTVDTVAHNSTRNTVCCLICGQAAGTAAALAAQGGTAPEGVDVAQLQDALRLAGALTAPQVEI
jgi:hypothetical protein